MATLVRKALELEGYSVDVAMTGTDAVWMGTENEYDAIVLDVMIPEPDGFELDFFGLTNAPGTSFTVVPEPTTALLLAFGLAGVACARRRR